MDITTMTLTELEALGYRLFLQAETTQQNRVLVQQEWAKRQQSTPIEPTPIEETPDANS